MIKIIFAFILTFTATAFATPQSELHSAQLQKAFRAQPDCQTFVRFDETNLYLGFSDALRIVPLDGSVTDVITMPEPPLEVISTGGQLFVLTSSSINKINLDTHQVLAQYAVATQANHGDRRQARGMALYQNTLIVANGRNGVSFIDAASGVVTKEMLLVQNQMSDHNPVESMATAITIQGQFAYVALDNYSITDGPPAFRGLIVIDMRTQTVVRQLSGFDAGADALMSDTDSIYVSYMGSPIVKYSIAKLQGQNHGQNQSQKLPTPERRVFNFGLQGHPTGLPSVDASSLYTCFVRDAAGVDQPTLRVPMIFSRQALQL